MGEISGAPARAAALSRTTSRRTVLKVAAATAAATAVPTAVAQTAAAAPAYDSKQRFVQLVGGGNGVIYAIQADGGLYWYRHSAWLTATPGFVSGSGRRIDSGWTMFTTVLGSFDGSLYGITADGVLRYYKYVVSNWTTGEGSFTVAKQIGSGFSKYTRVFGFNGNIYGVDMDGNLFLHSYNPSTGTWTFGSGKSLGGGWKSYTLFADAYGVVYGFRFGRVTWQRHTTTGTWMAGKGATLSSGFATYGLNGMHFLGAGRLYCVKPDAPTATPVNALYAWRIENYLTVGADGGPRWVNGGRDQQVGSGWGVCPTASLQGYALTRSVTQGSPARIAVSSGFASYSHSLVRVAPSAGDPVVVRGATAATGDVQTLPVGYFSTGCGWSERVSVPTSEATTPGLYALRLEGPSGMRRYVPFVVKPAAPTNKVAVLLPNLTYNAYNTYGGHSAYCGDLTGYRVTSLARPSTEESVILSGRLEHTLGSDILLTRWLTGQGVGFDCYYDTDLHDADWLPSYRVVVLGSHPEYWTDRMRARLADFVAGGGSIVCTGGNSIYERVQVDSAAGTCTYRRSDGGRDYFASLGLPASLLLGANYTSDTWFTFAPYRVVRTHEVLAGTGLAVGSVFGRSGYNGAGSGWETDGLLGLAGEASSSQIIAVGDNPGGGATMVLRESGFGGIIYTAASITFNGILATDAAASRLLRNVIDLAVAREPVNAAAVAPKTVTTPAPAQSEGPPIR